MKISHIHARQILDSRGNPTVEADVTLDNGIRGRAAVPSGASTGSHEAVELRDGDKSRFLGQGVMKAVEHVNTEIDRALKGMQPDKQRALDEKLISLDGTSNKGRLGANALLAVSLASAKAVAGSRNMHYFQYFHELTTMHLPFLLPLPMMNIINGGKHAKHSTDIQEFMIMPVGASSFSEAVRFGSEIFHTLGSVLDKRGYSTTVGDEGGYAPQVKQGNKEALDLVVEAVEKAGYKLGTDIVFALDIASSELHDAAGYHLKDDEKVLKSLAMIDWLQDLCSHYPIVSIEDGLAEDDWEGWQTLTGELGNNHQLVGDDIFVTNIDFLQRGISKRAANAILIKVNQIGTLTETIDAVEMAHKAGWHAIISHRSGETEDTTIAHLAVGLGTGQIKAGSCSRTDRVAKYNELLRIEETLGSRAQFAGKKTLQ